MKQTPFMRKNPVIEGACLGWRPPTKLTPWEWAAANVKIQNSERSGKFDPEQTPWWKGPMECAADFETRNIVVLAPTGSGKSTMVEYYCAVVCQPFLRINGRLDMESDSIIGRPWVNGGKMEYKIGDLPKAMQRGWMVLLDEPFKIPSGILMIIQRMMEKGGVLQIDDMPGTLSEKQIVADPRHRLTLADNVVGTGDNIDKYGATLIQDSSLLNRIDLVLQVPYLSQEDEVNWIVEKFAPIPKVSSGIPKHKAEQMVRMLNLLRKGFDQSELSSPASLRNIEAWARKAIQVRDYKRAFTWVLLNRYADDGEREAVRNMFFTVFGENI
jgi:MoxR-like ATPase